MTRPILVLLAAAAIGALTAAACNQISPPPTDPSAWPCNDPHYEWCPGRTGCCLHDEICRPDGMCANNSEIPTIRAQKPADAGADR
jgi:hypothetical protein